MLYHSQHPITPRSIQMLTVPNPTPMSIWTSSTRYRLHALYSHQAQKILTAHHNSAQYPNTHTHRQTRGKTTLAPRLSKHCSSAPLSHLNAPCRCFALVCLGSKSCSYFGSSAHARMHVCASKQCEEEANSQPLHARFFRYEFMHALRMASTNVPLTHRLTSHM